MTSNKLKKELKEANCERVRLVLVTYVLAERFIRGVSRGSTLFR